MLRGLDKLETEIGLIAMAHNLKKASLCFSTQKEDLYSSSEPVNDIIPKWQ